MQPSPGRRGFTLIEILIVISIIAIVASMVLAGVSMAKKQAHSALTKSTIQNLATALQTYYRDTGKYPGKEIADDENAMPALYEALFGDKPPKGGGGPSAPYMELKEDQVAVEDDSESGYRKAERDELNDPKVKKYIIDGFGYPMIYRETQSRARKKFMHMKTYDLYSKGPDHIDQTIEGEEGDDIGNW